MVCHVAENRQDLMIDNYSFGGHGLQYVDFIIQRILVSTNKEVHDVVIHN